MEYQEHPLPPDLDGFVAAVWTLRCGGARDTIVNHSAPPDGGVELIRRLAGWSRWGAVQPEYFAAGIALAPAPLTFSGDAQFIAVRLWPWAWNLTARPACAQFSASWCAVSESAAGLIAADPQQTILRLQGHFSRMEVPRAGDALLKSDTVAAAARRADMSVRALQRWSMREIGLSPRRFLRLVRFGRALQAIQHDESALALHAAGAGFADQPHMAREFRAFADAAPNAMRQKATGPFVPRTAEQS